MAFDQYLLDEADIKEIAELSAINLKENKGFSDLEGYAIQVIARRLAKDPMRYRDYGMYWASLKEVLRKHGFDYGEPTHQALREVYCGSNDLLTIVMADEFRKIYLSTWMIGSHEFMLDSESTDFTSIVDDYMEQLIPITE